MNIVVIGQGAIGLLWYHHLVQSTDNRVSLSCSSSISSAPTYYEFTDIEQLYGRFALNVADEIAFAKADVILPVSYTHLTLPTIYSV